MRFTAKVTGLESLNAKMNALYPAIRTDAGAEMDDQARSIVSTMKSYCPVGKDGPPSLRDSIGFAWDEGAPHDPEDLQLKFFVGARATPYAAYVEFGTSRTPAQPFFNPGFRVHKRETVTNIVAAVANAIRRVAGNGS
jgi:HK97 gp10 family phage protein